MGEQLVAVFVEGTGVQFDADALGLHGLEHAHDFGFVLLGLERSVMEVSELFADVEMRHVVEMAPFDQLEHILEIVGVGGVLLHGLERLFGVPAPRDQNTIDDVHGTQDEIEGGFFHEMRERIHVFGLVLELHAEADLHIGKSGAQGRQLFLDRRKAVGGLLDAENTGHLLLFVEGLGMVGEAQVANAGAMLHFQKLGRVGHAVGGEVVVEMIINKHFGFRILDFAFIGGLSYFSFYIFFEVSPEGEDAQGQKQERLGPVLFLQRLDQGDPEEEDEDGDVREVEFFHMTQF